MKTSICMLLDASEAMSEFGTSMIDGINEFIDEQKKIEDESKLYLLKFSDSIKIVYNKVDFNHLSNLESKDYTFCGQSDVYTAITEAINLLDLDSEVNSDERVLFVIFTAKEENCNQSPNEEEAIKLISNHQEANWSFIYIGKSSEKFAKKMGIPEKNVFEFMREDIKLNFKAASYACGNFRSNETEYQSLLSDFNLNELEAKVNPSDAEEVNDMKKFMKEVLNMFRPESPLDAFLLTIMVYIIHNYYYYFFDVLILVLVYYMSRWARED